MTEEESIKVASMTYESLASRFGQLSDLPYELADTVANIYMRFFSLPLLPFPRISLEETVLRQLEYEAITKAVYEYRGLPLKGADPTDMEYMKNFLLNAFKYRIDNVENKTPIRCLIERKFKRTQDIPGLVKVLGLYE